MQKATPKPKAADQEDPADIAMASLQHENPDALRILFARYSRLVFRIAYRILRDPGEAEEIVQECFFYIYRKALLFDPAKGSARSWIVQIAYSRARDRKLHLSRRGFYLHAESDSLRPEAQEEPSHLTAATDAVHDLCRLHDAFDALTYIQRETLRLFYFEELELQEISVRLNEPLGNVRHHYYRGLARLRKSAVTYHPRAAIKTSNPGFMAAIR